MTAPAGATARGITVPYRVRFDECTPDGAARTSAILRYAQDVAWIHSAQLGFDHAWYAERGLAWVVRAAELEVGCPIPFGQVLAVSTLVIGFRRVWARRRTEVHLDDGTLAAWAHIDWVMTDGRGAPQRVPADLPAVFGSAPGSFEPGRVPLPPTPPGARAWRSVVRPQDLDPMAHVNNAAYLDYLEEAIIATGPAGASAVAATPRAARLEYLVPAPPGAGLVGSAWPLDDGAGHGWAWRLAADDGRELARGRFTHAGREAR